MAKYIDAEILKAAFPEPKNWTDPESVLIHITGIWAVIDAIPAADVRENRHGRWIDVDDHLLCSNCGATYYGVDNNFCPNCGARMSE